MRKNSLFIKGMLVLITLLNATGLSVAQTYYQKLGEWQIDNTSSNGQVLNLSYSTLDKIVLLGNYASIGALGSMNINYQSSCGITGDYFYLEFDSMLTYKRMFRLGGLGTERDLQAVYTQKYDRDTLVFVGMSMNPDTGCDIHSTPRGGGADIWMVLCDTLGTVKNERLVGTSSSTNDQVRSCVFLDTCIILNIATDFIQFPNGDLWNTPPPCINCPPYPSSSLLNLSTFNYSLQKTSEKYIGPTNGNNLGTLMYDSVHHWLYLVGMVNTTQPNVMDVTQTGTGNDVWVVKMDEQLNILWDKRLVTPFEEDVITTVKFLPNGHILVSGGTPDYYGAGLQGTPRGDIDVFLYEFDTTGILVNDRCYGTAGDDAVGPISVLNNGLIMMSIRTRDGVSGDKTEPSRGGSDMWYLFLDANLNIVYQKTLGGAGEDEMVVYTGNISRDEAIYEWPDGSILVNIRSSSGISGDKTIPASSTNLANRDHWLVRFLPGLLTGLDEFPTLITTPFVYPNPTNGAITIQVENATNYRIIQPDGRILLQRTESTADKFIVDCSSWSSGVYIVEVLQKNGTRWLNRIVKE